MMSSNKQLDVGDEVVSFFLESTLGSISMPDIIDGKWGVVVTCAEAFDPVATTDLGILVSLQLFILSSIRFYNSQFYRHICRCCQYFISVISECLL